MLARLKSLFAGAPVTSATDLDDRMMVRALDLACDAAAIGEVPVGAVDYETGTGTVLGQGSNRREIDKDPSAHAEHIAILAAASKVESWRLSHCTVVVTLEPCPMCAGLIVNARLGRVVYGADDPKAGACRSLFSIVDDRRLNHRAEIIAGVRRDECSALLRSFFKSLRGRSKE